ncbi:hypothetical protein BU26DRAFT_157811 [Trematosphaeria pertusa]|uniref:Uncharacterized protein n=1 Tax=Trematosphaeria pertusa TaxID=390896 RepID=A0A6A6HY25_9PLEO|nr:uncharacterized protein BU26DRAFT_157811 [Trematosphaeria pertusa]KAF2242270.1 hypothetical protein BU26DRAFT_157811 [Trematosphaeria pertusa]
MPLQLSPGSSYFLIIVQHVVSKLSFGSIGQCSNFQRHRHSLDMGAFVRSKPRRGPNGGRISFGHGDAQSKTPMPAIYQHSSRTTREAPGLHEWTTHRSTWGIGPVGSLCGGSCSLTTLRLPTEMKSRLLPVARGNAGTQVPLILVVHQSAFRHPLAPKSYPTPLPSPLLFVLISLHVNLISSCPGPTFSQMSQLVFKALAPHVTRSPEPS